MMDTVHVHERIDADLAAPLSLPPPPPQPQPTTSDAGSEASLPASQLPLAGAPKSKEDEEYLEKLYSEKKIVGTTVGLDLTHKLINAGTRIGLLWLVRVGSVTPISKGSNQKFFFHKTVHLKCNQLIAIRTVESPTLTRATSFPKNDSK